MGALSRAVGEELDVTTENEAIEKAIKKLNELSYETVTYLVSLGGVVCRPVISGGRLQQELIPLGNYLPTSYDFDGTLTGCVICKAFDESGKKYLLIEKHEYKNKNHEVSTLV